MNSNHSAPTLDDVPPRVVIAGYACLTAFGDEQATWDALLAGRHINDHARAPISHATHRALNLARAVVARVIANAPLDPGAALVVGTSKGAVEDWLAPPPDGLATSDNPTGALDGWGLADIAGGLARSFGLHGPRMTTSAACASGLHALIRGAMMIRGGHVRQALVVATESSLHPLFVGTFGRLGVLARPRFGCRPFDRDREGFLISEAAAAVLLQAEDRRQTPTAKSSPQRSLRRGGPPSPPSVYLDRYALAADPTHLTGSDPAGGSMRRLLAHVLGGRPVDLFHAHGTGTTLNDAIELAAIDAAVGAREMRPAVYSHKAAVGHSLGASGLLSVVISCMCHQYDIVPPNPLTRNPLPAVHVTISREPIERPIRRSVAASAGFGGAMAAVGLCSG